MKLFTSKKKILLKHKTTKQYLEAIKDDKLNRLYVKKRL